MNEDSENKFNEKWFEEKLSKIGKEGELFSSDKYKEKVLNDKSSSSLWWIYFYMYRDYHLHYIEETDYNYTPTYIPQRRFNYFILIKESLYKKLKDHIDIKVIWVNEDFVDISVYYSLNELSKFIRLHKNKESIYKNGIRYIKLKLRAYNNTFVSYLKIEIKKKFLREISNDIFYILQKPVTKKYTNVIKLYKGVFDRFLQSIIKHKEMFYKEEVDFSDDNFTLFLFPYKCDKKYVDDIIDTILNNKKTFIKNNQNLFDCAFQIYNNTNDTYIGFKFINKN